MSVLLVKSNRVLVVDPDDTEKKKKSKWRQHQHLTVCRERCCTLSPSTSDLR